MREIVGPVRPLSSDREAFCQAMAFHSTTDLNQSAIYAQTHDVSTLNHKTICEMASRLMADSKIVARIEELRRPVVERFQVHHEVWLHELMDMAFVNPKDFFDEHGNPIDTPNLPNNVQKMLAGFEIQELFIGKPDEGRVPAGYTRKYKLLSKVEAIKLFGEALGFFPDKGSKMALKDEIKDKDR